MGHTETDDFFGLEVQKCSRCGNPVSGERDTAGGLICHNCYTKEEQGICYKCGRSIVGQALNGLCNECAQILESEKATYKLEENIMYGVEKPLSDMNGEQFNDWLTHKATAGLGPEDFKTNVVFRRMWIVVKLSASGIYDNIKISDNLKDLEKLVARNYDNIIGHKTKLTIIEGDAENKYSGYKLLDKENKAYLFADID